MLAREVQEGSERTTLRVDRALCPLHRRGDMVAHPARHVGDERTEDRVLRIEIGVETAQRGASATRDITDRRIVETAFAELARRSVEQFAQRPPPALGARRLFRVTDTFCR